MISYKKNQSQKVTLMTFTSHVELRKKDSKERSMDTGSQLSCIEYTVMTSKLL